MYCFYCKNSIFEDYLAESVADNVSTFKLQNAVQEYQRGCQDILAEFQKINAAVKDVEEKLLANNNSSEKDLLRSIQLLERDNFETVSFLFFFWKFLFIFFKDNATTTM